MLRSPISRPLGRQFPIWRNVPKRNYSAERQPGQAVVDQQDAPSPATSTIVLPEPPASNHRNLASLASGNPSSSKDEPFTKATPLTSIELEKLKQRMREWTEHTAIVVRTRADDFTATTKTTFSQLGAHLNKVTGYEEIEALKRDVVAQENRINEARLDARKSKTTYEEAVLQRSKSQREVNDLLQRKSMWTDNDVSRFTTLVRQDHLYEQEEARAKVAVNTTEDVVEKEFSQLMRLILARYHEEQVWSDKIRSASTYGQLAVLGLNMLVFILAIVLVEPWKRKRLAQTFERKVEELSQEYSVKLEVSMAKMEGVLAEQRALLLSLSEQLAATPNVEVVERVEAIPPPSPDAPPPPPAQVEEAWTIPVKSPTKRLDQRSWELVVVGTGAFLVGVAGSVLFNY